MSNQSHHTFHIPVMGLGYTIDTPLKVARYGIDSVVSIMEDHLIEEMRRIHCEKQKREYCPINSGSATSRTNRITAYLNLLDELVQEQMEAMKSSGFKAGSELTKYFELLPDEAMAKQVYLTMLVNKDKILKFQLQCQLLTYVKAGSIDVNIMTKLDKSNYSSKGELLPEEFSDAKSALKGFAQSNLSSAVIFSAGMNPSLFSFCEQFDDFYPNRQGLIKKRIILKVSDFRSAMVQGKMLAKKGILISEFRIESGLNCGGHAFATQGHLLGPILDEFKSKKYELYKELTEICKKYHLDNNRPTFLISPTLKITVQGGIGTSEENEFLMSHYEIDGTGWGSPFLMVPESTNVDPKTLEALLKSDQEDYYLSNVSPLGVPINNFKLSTSQSLKQDRITKNRPGSPCYKKFLASNTEFTTQPICTASRQYQKLKLAQIKASDLNPEMEKKATLDILEKECLCEGLGTSARISNQGKLSHKIEAVSICPGPNLFYFKGTYKLSEMIDHIYGRINLLNEVFRPHVFINEAQLYIDFLKKEMEAKWDDLTAKQRVYFHDFKHNIEKGLNYYSELFSNMLPSSKWAYDSLKTQMEHLKNKLNQIQTKELLIQESL